MNSQTQSDGLTLVLGGTGKTGRRVVDGLASRDVATRVASRTGDPPFDWADQSTWDAVLDGVTAAYISYAPDLAIPGGDRCDPSLRRPSGGARGPAAGPPVGSRGGRGAAV